MTQNTAVQEVSRASSASIITNQEYMNNVMTMAKLMAGSKVTVPKHLQNSEGDCAAIVMQSMNWGMDPFVVAQKTHLVNGTLGYEAQLVNAVVQATNAITGAFSYEYKDETANSCSCRVGAVIKGQKAITWGPWLSSNTVTTKNSPLWKTNVPQQMGYLQVKNWARQYAPAALLGVYTTDELSDMPEKDITPEVEKETTYLDDATFNDLKDKYRDTVVSGKKSSDDFINWVESKGALMTDKQKKEVGTWVKKPDVVEGEAREVDDDFVNEMNNAEGGE